MNYATTVIIGAGQSGLAMSKHLTDRSIDHVLIERGEIANSWRKERWDSLRLLTPNWQSRLPGFRYGGDDPDGYMAMPEVVRYLESFADFARAPVRAGTRVTRVTRAESGYVVETDRGAWRCRKVVLANGACNIATVPALAAGLPANIASITPMQYRNPAQLADGGVMIVGAAATGIQLARELHASGRRVVLSVGEHVRLPRIYRGRDIAWWMDKIGIMSMRYDEIEDIGRARRVPSLQLIGTPERRTIDLNSLRESGVEIVGRLVGLQDGKAQFSGSLTNHCMLADLKMNRMLDGIDTWVSENACDGAFEAPHRFAPTELGPHVPLGMNLNDGDIKTVIWATGYRPDYSWLDVPVFDRKGRIRHDGGVVDLPGMYVMGLPFMRRRNSSFIDGADQDAADLAEHMNLNLRSIAA